MGGEAWIGSGARSQFLINIVHLCTISRGLASTLMGRPDLRDIGTITREQVRDALIDAFNNPDASIYGGRPRAGDGGHLVEKIVVVKEERKDATFHFHVGVNFSFPPCIRMRRSTVGAPYFLPLVDDNVVAIQCPIIRSKL